MGFDPVLFTGAVMLFSVAAVVMLIAPLVIGLLLRPDKQNPEKSAIYECGEPTIRSSVVQFDLRFYVVALLFIVFDVEVAFFFPWAVVFGKASTLKNERLTVPERAQVSVALQGGESAVAFPSDSGFIDGEIVKWHVEPGAAVSENQELADVKEKAGERVYTLTSPTAGTVIKTFGQAGEAVRIGAPMVSLVGAVVESDTAGRFLKIAFVDLLVFFGFVLVGFAYVWKRGDLDWVRAYTPA